MKKKRKICFHSNFISGLKYWKKKWLHIIFICKLKYCMNFTYIIFFLLILLVKCPNCYNCSANLTISYLFSGITIVLLLLHWNSNFIYIHVILFSLRIWFTLFTIWNVKHISMTIVLLAPYTWEISNVDSHRNWHQKLTIAKRLMWIDVNWLCWMMLAVLGFLKGDYLVSHFHCCSLNLKHFVVNVLAMVVYDVRLLIIFELWLWSDRVNCHLWRNALWTNGVDRRLSMKTVYRRMHIWLPNQPHW